MPKFFKQNLLSSPLDTPELPAGDQEQEEYHQAFRYGPVRTLLTWKAPSRPHRKKDRSYYTTATILVVLVALISIFLFGEILIIAVLSAFLFMFYVLNFVEPEEIEYKISTQGVTIGDHFYHWDELDSFWFEEKDGFKLLHILTQLRFPAVLMIVMGDVSEEEVKNTVAEFLPFHEIAPKSFIDKWSASLQKHILLENPHR